MKHLNRITIFIIIAAMSLMMMTACGSSSETGYDEKAPADVVEETTAAQDESSVQEASSAGDANDIGAEKVKEIVLAKVPGAVEDSIYEFERDYDDGRLEYEGSIYHNGYEYEFEVDGVTGNILQWEIDD